MMQSRIIAVVMFVMAGLALSSPLSRAQAVESSAATPSPTSRTITGLTAPSERLKLSLPTGGVVAERNVKPGEAVKKGQVLIILDRRFEQKTLDRLNIEADSTAQIEAAEADLRLRKVQLGRKEKMLEQKVAGLSEVEEARLQVEIGEIRLKLQSEEHQTKGLEREGAKIKVDQTELKSPIDGLVEAVDVGPGEWADPQKPTGSVTVVQNDPLWVEIHLPTKQSQKLDRNTPLMVKGQDDEKEIAAKIIYISPVADAASDTQLVRLELPNPQNRSSGLQVTVTLPDNIAALAENR